MHTRAHTHAYTRTYTQRKKIASFLPFIVTDLPDYYGVTAAGNKLIQCTE